MMEVLHDRPVILIFSLAILYLFSFAALLHILLNMRDETERAKLWLLFVLAFPGLGVLLYLCCGLNRRDTLGHRVKRIGGEVETTQDPALQNLLAKRNLNISRFHAKDMPSEPYLAMLDRQFPAQPPLTGNRAELLCDGNGAYPAMLQAINQAKTSIHMQSFIIADDKIGHILFNAMEKRAKEAMRENYEYYPDCDAAD
jgi:cardiolipin synthase